MDVAFGFFAFCMMIYISTAMVTKKDLRRMLGTQRDGRAPALRSMLAERKGSTCTLILTGSALTFPGQQIRLEPAQIFPAGNLWRDREGVRWGRVRFNPSATFGTGSVLPKAALPSTGHPLPAPMAEVSGPMGPPVGTTLLALNKAPGHSPCQELLTGACALTGRHVGNLRW